MSRRLMPQESTWELVRTVIEAALLVGVMILLGGIVLFGAVAWGDTPPEYAHRTDTEYWSRAKLRGYVADLEDQILLHKETVADLREQLVLCAEDVPPTRRKAP